MYDYIHISTLRCTSDMEYMFVVCSFICLFVCLHVDHNVTSSLLYPCLYLYICSRAPMLIFLPYFYYIFNSKSLKYL